MKDFKINIEKEILENSAILLIDHLIKYIYKRSEKKEPVEWYVIY